MNRNKLLAAALWLIMFAAIGVLFTLHFSRQKTYAYVDAQKLLNGYKGMQAARKQYEVQVMSWRSNLDTLRGEMEERVKEYETKKSKITARELALMEQLIDAKHEQYMNFEQVVTEKIRGADQELTAKVLSKVNDYIRRYGKQEGYDIIMAATQYGNIVYAKDKIDITQEVLNGLNLEYEK
jgi:outer membrane protein